MLDRDDVKNSLSETIFQIEFRLLLLYPQKKVRTMILFGVLSSTRLMVWNRAVATVPHGGQNLGGRGRSLHFNHL